MLLSDCMIACCCHGAGREHPVTWTSILVHGFQFPAVVAVAAAAAAAAATNFLNKF
jgi:hypothetical protein